MGGKADIGLVGLAVMGQNLVLNMLDKGFKVAVHNRSPEKVRDFLGREGPSRPGLSGHEDVRAFAAALARPRKVMLMVKAGEAVDAAIASLLPHLEPGDLIIDGGNSHYLDSARRAAELEAKGLLYVGTGVSGGEEGARHGPSMMPGGSRPAWPLVEPIFRAIAAKAPGGEPCCAWVGPGGSGHFVKMVHNGIEYGDMEIIAEAYGLLAGPLGLPAREIAAAFAAWKEGPLSSYLVEITADILGRAEPDGTPLVERILDAAGQKGTGKWTGQAALDLGLPLSLITEAVYARSLSALRDERIAAARQLPGPGDDAGAAAAGAAGFAADIRDGIGAVRSDPTAKAAFVEDMKRALLASKIVSYAQGFMLLRRASEEYGWGLDLGSIAMLWREGCIIRSAFLGDIKAAYARDARLPNLLLDPWFAARIAESQGGWRRIVAAAALSGAPAPAMSSALAFYDGYRSEKLPANLIQAQRDYFGAHGYERTDRPRGEHFHTDWIGSGGKASAGDYNA